MGLIKALMNFTKEVGTAFMEGVQEGWQENVDEEGIQSDSETKNVFKTELEQKVYFSLAEQNMDEVFCLKIMSVSGDVVGRVIDIIVKVTKTNVEVVSNFFEQLPNYLFGSKVVLQKLCEELWMESVNAVILSKVEYENEIHYFEYEDEIHVIEENDEKMNFEINMNKAEEVSNVEQVYADKGTYILEITNVGSNKVKIIKDIRECIGCQLKEAKEFVDNVPQSITGSYDMINNLKEKLLEDGAITTLHRLGE